MIRHTGTHKRAPLFGAALALAINSLPTFATEDLDAQEQARRLLSRPLVTQPSQPLPQIEQNDAPEEPDAFRQAMILLGHQ